MGKDLSNKRTLYLVMVDRFITKQGYPPTYEEIASIMQVAKNTAIEQINYLILHGWLTRVVNQKRTLRLTEKGCKLVQGFNNNEDI